MKESLESTTFRRDRKLGHIIAFQFQKGLFSHDSSTISGQVPVLSNHSVAWYDDADRIMTDRPADCLRGHPFKAAFLCNPIGDPAVRNRLSKWYFTHDLPDAVAESGSCPMNSRKEPGVAA